MTSGRRARIHGVVIGPSGTPLGKVPVTLHGPPDDREPGVRGSGEPTEGLGRRVTASESKPDGTFAFDELAPGAGYGLLALASDGATARVTGLELKEDESREVRLQVKPGWAIRGRALLGVKPCEGARVVTCIQVGNRLEQIDTVTDREGRFVLQALQPGTIDISVTFEKDGETCFGRHSVELNDPGMKDIGDIVLGSHGRITGRVLDPKGAPLKDATVWVISRSGDESSSVTVRTDADGRFAIEGLGSGLIDVSVMPAAGGDPALEPLNLEGVSPTEPLSLQLKERRVAEKATLVIRLKHPGPAPERGAVRLSVFGDQGVVLCGGSNGQDAWTRQLEIGKSFWVLGASGNRWGRTPKVTITAGRNEVELSFSEEGVAIAATVINDSTGNPIAKAEVHLSQDRSLEKGAVYAMEKFATDDEGRFVCIGLAPDLGAWLLFDVDGFERKVVHIPVGGGQAAPLRLIPKGP